MKILTLVWSIGIGGTERAVVNYAIGYKQFGHDSKVMVLGEGTERLNDLLEAGVETTILSRSPQSSEELFKQLREWAPEIIHIHNYHDSLLPYINNLKSPETKVVETNVFSRPHYEKGYQVVSLSMQLSAWGYWKYTNWMKGSAYTPQVAIVPYTVLSNKFPVPSTTEVQAFLETQKIPVGSFVVGRLGQSLPTKWDLRIIKVIEETVKPDNKIYFFFVGAPDTIKEELNRKSQFIKSRVRLIDKIAGDKNLSLYYHSLNCFSHIAHIGESFGYVLVEALLSKVPVVTMLTPLKDNAQFEIVGHEFGGYCVTDTRQYIEAVFTLYRKPEVRTRLINNLANWIDSRFSPSVVIPMQINLYRQLLEGKAIPQANVSSVVKTSFKLYGYTAPFQYLLSKIVNHRLTYLLIQKMKAVK